MNFAEKVFNKLVEEKARKYGVPVNEETKPHLLEEVKNDFKGGKNASDDVSGVQDNHL